MNTYYAKCLLLAAAVGLSSCAKDLSPQERIAEAARYTEAGDFEAARIELLNAARDAKDNAEVRFELASVYLLQGDSVFAEKELRRAQELGMPESEVFPLLIKALFLQGNFEDVLSESAAFPDQLQVDIQADIFGYRAQALIEQGEYRSAEAVLNQALELNPNSLVALLSKASYEARVGSRELALELAQKVVNIDPESDDGWAMIGDIYFAAGDLPKAKEAYDRAVAAVPYESLVSAKRAFVLAQMEDYDGAASDIQSLMKSDYRSYPYVNFVRGYIAFKNADYQTAAEAFEIAAARDPDDTSTKFYLVASYLRLNRLEQARALANQLYVAIPNSVEVSRMLASLNFQAQDFAAVRQALSSRVGGAEEDPMALGMLGSMALMEGDGDLAADYLERLVALEPDNQAARRMRDLALIMRGDFVGEVNALAQMQVTSSEEFDKALLSAAVALKQGQLKEALTIAENLHQQYPDSIRPLNMLAAVYLVAGDWRTGRKFLEQVLALEPLQPTATKTLAKIYLGTGEEALALELISAYRQKNPQDDEASGIQSRAIVALESYENSEKLLIEMLENTPDNLEIQARLAQLYFDTGKYEQVLFRTNNLSKEVVQRQQLLIELRGKALLNLGEVERASETWERWVSISPDSVLANFYNAESLIVARQWRPALEYLEKCRNLNAGYLPARMAIIKTTALAGDTEKASAEMAQLRSEITEDRGDVWYLQGWLSAKDEKYADAEQALNKSLAAQPTPAAALLLFTVMNAQARADEALPLLEAWLDQFPQNTAIMNILAQSYLGQNDQESAIAMYRRIVEVAPGSVLALNNLAWFTQEADLSQAIDYAQQANALAPDEPVILDTLGVLLAKNGQNKQAERLLRKAMALQPDNLAFQLHLARVLFSLGVDQEATAIATRILEEASDAQLVAEAGELLNSPSKTL